MRAICTIGVALLLVVFAVSNINKKDASPDSFSMADVPTNDPELLRPIVPITYTKQDDEGEGIPEFKPDDEPIYGYKPDWYDDEPKWAEGLARKSDLLTEDQVRKIVADELEKALAGLHDKHDEILEAIKHLDSHFHDDDSPPRLGDLGPDEEAYHPDEAEGGEDLPKPTPAEKLPGVNGQWVESRVQTGWRDSTETRHRTVYQTRWVQRCINGRCRTVQVQVPVQQSYQVNVRVPVYETKRTWQAWNDDTKTHGDHGRSYQPIWEINDGKSVTQHLIDGYPGRHAPQDPDYVNSLTIDEQWMLHDSLHNSEVQAYATPSVWYNAWGDTWNNQSDWHYASYGNEYRSGHGRAKAWLSNFGSGLQYFGGRLRERAQFNAQQRAERRAFRRR